MGRKSCHVGDAANVVNRDGFAKTTKHDEVAKRSERRAFAARGDITCVQFRDGQCPRSFRDDGRFTKLQGRAGHDSEHVFPLGDVVDGLAGETDDIDLFGREAAFRDDP